MLGCELDESGTCFDFRLSKGSVKTVGPTNTPLWEEGVFFKEKVDQALN